MGDRRIRTDVATEFCRNVDGTARKGIGFDEARPILWIYTSREIYRMLVINGRIDARPLS